MNDGRKLVLAQLGDHFLVDGTCGSPLPDAYAAIMNLTVQDEQVHNLPRAC